MSIQLQFRKIPETLEAGGREICFNLPNYFAPGWKTLQRVTAVGS